MRNNHVGSVTMSRHSNEPCRNNARAPYSLLFVADFTNFSPRIRSESRIVAGHCGGVLLLSYTHWRLASKTLSPSIPLRPCRESTKPGGMHVGDIQNTSILNEIPLPLTIPHPSPLLPADLQNTSEQQRCEQRSCGSSIIPIVNIEVPTPEYQRSAQRQPAGRRQLARSSALVKGMVPSAAGNGPCPHPHDKRPSPSSRVVRASFAQVCRDPSAFFDLVSDHIGHVPSTVGGGDCVHAVQEGNYPARLRGDGRLQQARNRVAPEHTSREPTHPLVNAFPLRNCMPLSVGGSGVTAQSLARWRLG